MVSFKEGIWGRMAQREGQKRDGKNIYLGNDKSNRILFWLLLHHLLTQHPESLIKKYFLSSNFYKSY